MKVWSYMAIMLTMMIFLTFIGIVPGNEDKALQSVGLNFTVNTTQSTIDNADIDVDPDNSAWNRYLWETILVGVATAGLVVVGVLTRSFEWKLIMVPFFAVFVVNFVGFGWSIIQVATKQGEAWLSAIAVTIFLPLTAMFVFSIIEWFGGSPND